VGLRGFFDGGEDGVVGFDGFLKELMDLEMEVWRARGREVQRSEEGLMLWIKVFNEGFADLRESFTADARNDSADVCRDERSLFSISQTERGGGEWGNKFEFFER